jgi:hypothetical protein
MRRSGPSIPSTVRSGARADDNRGVPHTPVGVAIVNLPNEVTRGWRWLYVAFTFFIGAFMLYWVATGHVITSKRGNPVPTWGSIGIGLAMVVGAVYMIVERLLERKAGREWAYSAQTGPRRMGFSEAATGVAFSLGIDAQHVGSETYESLVRAEHRVQQRLPRVWIDGEVLSPLLAGAPTGRFRFPLRARQRRWLNSALGLSLCITVIFTMMLVSLWISAPPKPSWVVTGIMAGPLVVSITLFVLWLVSPRAQLVFAAGRALLVRGRHEQRLDNGSAFVIITHSQGPQRGRWPSSRRITRDWLFQESGVRWWILAQGQPPMYCDDLPLANTPWSHAVALAAAVPESSSVCMRCGYSLMGLPSRKCPECGAVSP